MEKFRIVYFNLDGEASEAIVSAKNGDAAIAQVKDLGRLPAAGLTSLGPADADEPEADPQGSVSYPWGSREERIADQGGPDA